MLLATGSRLGSYEIVAPLGADGPPSLACEGCPSFGGSTVAMERTGL